MVRLSMASLNVAWWLRRTAARERPGLRMLRESLRRAGLGIRQPEVARAVRVVAGLLKLSRFLGGPEALSHLGSPHAELSRELVAGELGLTKRPRRLNYLIVGWGLSHGRHLKRIQPPAGVRCRNGESGGAARQIRACG